MKGLIAIKAWRESIELEENAAEKEASRSHYRGLEAERPL